MHRNSSSASAEGVRALITGGAGTVGSHIADALLAAGAREIRVLDLPSAPWEANLAAARSRGRLIEIEGDVRDRPLVDEAMHGVDVVFHQAATRLGSTVEDPALAHEVSADGTFHVIDAAANAGVERLVAASSAAVYGEVERDRIAESERTDHADSLYGALKAYGEALLRVYAASRSLHTVALRYFNVYGPRMHTHGSHTEVLVRWIDRIERGEPPVVDGDGTQTLDLIHVDDVATANLLAATTASRGRVFNVGTGKAVTLNDLARTLLRVMRSDLSVEYGPPRSLNAASRRVADPTEAERALGFRARVPLEAGLHDLVRWWRHAGRVPV
jgi:UDP-glucose 4-epimerase